MSKDRSRRPVASKAAVKRSTSLFVVFALLAGCSVVEGNSGAGGKSTATATPAPVATPAAADMLADGGIASSGIPIPLISPRHLGVQVASIDPRAGLSVFSGGMPVSRIAGVYLQYDDALASVETAKLKTPKDVRRVLKTLRFSEPESMAEGWYAVEAMTAAQNTLFAQGVRDEVRIKGKDAVLASLNEPNYVLGLPGAGAAITAVVASVSAENDRMIELKQKLLDTAYKFQKQKWGMIEPLEPVKAADAGSTSAVATFKTALAAVSPVTEAHAYSPVVMTKILAEGARQVISAPLTPAVAENDETASCLNWARLNLDQCVAAAHFPSEEAWCTGKHAIDEVRTCWATVLPSRPTAQ